MNDTKLNSKGLSQIERVILILTVLFAFMPVAIGHVDVLGPGDFDYVVTIYNSIIIKHENFSDEEFDKYIDMPYPVMPKIYRSLMIGLVLGFISFLCMKGKHYLFSMWFFIIFIISMIPSCVLFYYKVFHQPRGIMVFPQALMFLTYAFCNLYVGYKKVRDYWRKKTESGKIEHAVP